MITNFLISSPASLLGYGGFEWIILSSKLSSKQRFFNYISFCIFHESSTSTFIQKRLYFFGFCVRCMLETSLTCPLARRLLKIISSCVLTWAHSSILRSLNLGAGGRDSGECLRKQTRTFTFTHPASPDNSRLVKTIMHQSGEIGERRWLSKGSEREGDGEMKGRAMTGQ